MAHPRNKYERVKIGKTKGKARTRNWEVSEQWPESEKDEIREIWERQHRNTTKQCGGVCCANPRKHFKEKTIQEKQQEEKEKLGS